MKTDAALDALLLPFAQRLLKAEPGALFLRAREGAAVHALGLRGKLTCVQPFKPWAEALQRAGFDVASEPPAGTFPQAWLLPPRQREEARALIAAAFDACRLCPICPASVPMPETELLPCPDARLVSAALRCHFTSTSNSPHSRKRR